MAGGCSRALCCALVALAAACVIVDAEEGGWADGNLEREGLATSAPQSVAQRSTLVRERADLMSAERRMQANVLRTQAKVAEVDALLRSRKSPTLGEEMRLEDRPGVEALRMLMAPAGPNAAKGGGNKHSKGFKASREKRRLGGSSGGSTKLNADYRAGFREGKNCKRNLYSKKYKQMDLLVDELFNATRRHRSSELDEEELLQEDPSVPSTGVGEGGALNSKQQLKESWGQVKKVIDKLRAQRAKKAAKQKNTHVNRASTKKRRAQKDTLKTKKLTEKKKTQSVQQEGKRKAAVPVKAATKPKKKAPHKKQAEKLIDKRPKKSGFHQWQQRGTLQTPVLQGIAGKRSAIIMFSTLVNAVSAFSAVLAKRTTPDHNSPQCNEQMLKGWFPHPHDKAFCPEDPADTRMLDSYTIRGGLREDLDQPFSPSPHTKYRYSTRRSMRLEDFQQCGIMKKCSGSPGLSKLQCNCKGNGANGTSDDDSYRPEGIDRATLTLLQKDSKSKICDGKATCGFKDGYADKKCFPRDEFLDRLKKQFCSVKKPNGECDFKKAISPFSALTPGWSKCKSQKLFKYCRKLGNAISTGESDNSLWLTWGSLPRYILNRSAKANATRTRDPYVEDAREMPNYKGFCNIWRCARNVNEWRYFCNRKDKTCAKKSLAGTKKLVADQAEEEIDERARCSTRVKCPHCGCMPVSTVEAIDWAASLVRRVVEASYKPILKLLPSVVLRLIKKKIGKVMNKGTVDVPVKKFLYGLGLGCGGETGIKDTYEYYDKMKEPSVNAHVLAESALLEESEESEAVWGRRRKATTSTRTRAIVRANKVSSCGMNVACVEKSLRRRSPSPFYMVNRARANIKCRGCLTKRDVKLAANGKVMTVAKATQYKAVAVTMKAKRKAKRTLKALKKIIQDPKGAILDKLVALVKKVFKVLFTNVKRAITKIVPRCFAWGADGRSLLCPHQSYKDYTTVTGRNSTDTSYLGGRRTNIDTGKDCMDLCNANPKCKMCQHHHRKGDCWLFETGLTLTLSSLF